VKTHNRNFHGAKIRENSMAWLLQEAIALLLVLYSAWNLQRT